MNIVLKVLWILYFMLLLMLLVAPLPLNIIEFIVVGGVLFFFSVRTKRARSDLKSWLDSSSVIMFIVILISFPFVLGAVSMGSTMILIVIAIFLIVGMQKVLSKPSIEKWRTTATEIGLSEIEDKKWFLIRDRDRESVAGSYRNHQIRIFEFDASSGGGGI